jgi:hypothetical protein
MGSSNGIMRNVYRAQPTGLANFLHSELDLLLVVAKVDHTSKLWDMKTSKMPTKRPGGHVDSVNSILI